MVTTPVEAVWIWLYGTAAQKATYGRISDSDDKSFTKDFLQVSGECSSLFDTLFPMPVGADRKDIVYRWPGGKARGSIRHPNDRYHLRWGTAEKAPEPWRLTLTPSAAGPGTIPGDPDRTSSIADANSALADYEAKSLTSYLVAVKLVGEDDVLHIRAYISNPPEDLAFADTNKLPPKVLEALQRIRPKNVCASVRLSSQAPDADITGLLEKLEENPNLLLTGPPGTGKSVALDKLAKYVEGSDSGVRFDPEKNHDAWDELGDSTEPGKSTTVVLHPSYSYDNLAVGLLPQADNGAVTVGVTTGPLVNLAHFASNGRRALLVLDEFNRGNAAAILGDTLALLDKDKRGKAHIDLPSYGLSMNVPAEFSVDGNTEVESHFTLPESLWIVAAMNSSDRSVAPLDAALRRRFSIVEIGPDYALLERQILADTEAALDTAWEEWTTGYVGKLASELLRSLNRRIEASLGRDFVLGHSNFWHVGGDSPEEALYSLAAAWDRRVVQTLRLALQDDEDTLAFILRAGQSNVAVETSSHAVWWKKADPAFEQFANPRLAFNDLAPLPTGEKLTELKRLAGF